MKYNKLKITILICLFMIIAIASTFTGCTPSHDIPEGIYAPGKLEDTGYIYHLNTNDDAHFEHFVQIKGNYAYIFVSGLSDKYKIIQKENTLYLQDTQDDKIKYEILYDSNEKTLRLIWQEEN